MLPPAALDRAFGYIRERPEIWEVIVTGGDPFLLAPRRLAAIVQTPRRDPACRASSAFTPACRSSIRAASAPRWSRRWRRDKAVYGRRSTPTIRAS